MFLRRRKRRNFSKFLAFVTGETSFSFLFGFVDLLNQTFFVVEICGVVWHDNNMF